MYVEKDGQGKIIIQDISQNEAEVLDDCFCSYINGKPAKDRTEAEMLVVRLKRELEKLY